MSKLGTIATWAYSMVNRPDKMDMAVDFAKDFYILLCNKVPFHSLRSVSTWRAMVVDDGEYDISDLSSFAIFSVMCKYSTTSKQRLRKKNVRFLDTLPDTSRKPIYYARDGENLVVWPPPDSADYTYRIRYWQKPVISPPFDQVDLITPEEWDELLKWETLYRLYTVLDEHEKAMLLMQPSMLPRQSNVGSPKHWRNNEVGIIPRLWNDLLLTVDMRELEDADYNIKPLIYRGYNA